MLTNDELKEKLKKVHPEYLERSKSGGDKWKTARIFTTILYPENIDDVSKCCEDLQLPCSLSPLHDSDIKDSETGELKKAHYHLVIYYKGKTTPYACYTALVGAFGESAFSTIEIGHDLGALICYHCHLNNSDKFEYDVADIKDFNGFSSSKYLLQSKGDTVSNFNDLMDYIDNNNILFMNDLYRSLRYDNPILYSALVLDRVLSRDVKDYIKGREHQLYYDGVIERRVVCSTSENGDLTKRYERAFKVS